MIIFALIIVASQLCCNTQNENNTEFLGNGIIPYNLNKPDKKVKLDMVLQEISALSYYKIAQVASLQDEDGDIFIIDHAKENIANKITIAGKGDFEGIELVDSTVYMLKSNGQLIKVVGFMNDEPTEITQIKTGLSAKNNCEGLGYDKQSNSLLIACKSKPYLDKKHEAFKGKRAIYAYDLKKQELARKPRYLLNRALISEMTGKKEFMPSGIAVHPVTNNIYIVASVGKLLIVLNKAGIIVDFANLDPKIFRQPEGICFSPDGKKLYISNEGKNKRGNILVFDKKQ